LKSLWAKRHSLEGPKNWPNALEDGAQSGVALRPFSVIIELGLLSVWTACVRRRQVKGAPGRKGAQRPDRSAWVLRCNSAIEFRPFGFGSFDIDWNLGFGHWDFKSYT
jgi:hypothetical protein